MTEMMTSRTARLLAGAAKVTGPVTVKTPDTPFKASGIPSAQGLYDPRNEHDACGVGFVAHMKGEASHSIIEDGLFILENLTHRGAVGADPLMGDGAGLTAQIPHQFFKEELAKEGIDLPEPGQYAAGFLFMPQDDDLRAHMKDIIREVIADVT